MPDAELHLLPYPREVERSRGSVSIGGPLRCAFKASGEILRPAVSAFETLAVPPGPPTTVTLSQIRGFGNPEQYLLSVKPDGIHVAAYAVAGAVNAARTLDQLIHQFPGELPCLRIDDWPDFPVRGVMLDVSRDKVPTMDTLRVTVDRLAGWKINQLQLYTEHTFAYADHRTVWAHASPITAEEIRELDAYCRERFIELVPNQNSFGHMERWLKHPRYAHLAEAIDGAETPWGFRWEGPFSLCPTDPASLKFLSGLYAELLPNFTSRLFNVGFDETFDIGQGRSRAAVERSGVTAVYLDFLRRVNDRVQSHGRRMMFWGDIILHHPEQIANLPPEVIALNWGYEADHPFDKDGAAFAAAGVPFYVCPGTSTWNSIAGRTDNCLANLRNAAEAGRTHGAAGYLITDWGDNGHLQYQSASYLGFMAGAAMSWCEETNADTDWAMAFDRLALPGLGHVAVQLGNVYQSLPKPNANGSALFRLLVPPPFDAHPEKGLTANDLDAAEAAIAAVAIGGNGLDADEFRNAAEMLRLCVAAGRRRLGLTTDFDPTPLIAEHRRLWLARNRPGGLDDSCRRLTL